MKYLVLIEKKKNTSLDSSSHWNNPSKGKEKDLDKQKLRGFPVKTYLARNVKEVLQRERKWYRSETCTHMKIGRALEKKELSEGEITFICY